MIERNHTLKANRTFKICFSITHYLKRKEHTNGALKRLFAHTWIIQSSRSSLWHYNLSQLFHNIMNSNLIWLDGDMNPALVLKARKVFLFSVAFTSFEVEAQHYYLSFMNICYHTTLSPPFKHNETRKVTHAWVKLVPVFGEVGGWDDVGGRATCVSFGATPLYVLKF